MNNDDILSKYTLEQVEDFIDEIIIHCGGQESCKNCIFRNKYKNCYFGDTTPSEWKIHVNDIPHVFEF